MSTNDSHMVLLCNKVASKTHNGPRAIPLHANRYVKKHERIMHLLFVNCADLTTPKSRSLRCLMSQKDCNVELGVTSGLRGHWVRRPMDMILAAALALLIVGCVVGYGVRAEVASDRPAEPRRRRPF
jgi:hypothetical protein